MPDSTIKTDVLGRTDGPFVEALAAKIGVTEEMLGSLRFGFYDVHREGNGACCAVGAQNGQCAASVDGGLSGTETMHVVGTSSATG